MAKSKRKPVARKKRVYRAKKKKGGRVLLGTISFIVIVVLSLMALQFINKKIARDADNVRISEEELNEEIEKIDRKLNEIFSEIGLKKREIISKKNDRRKKDDRRTGILVTQACISEKEFAEHFPANEKAK